VVAGGALAWYQEAAARSTSQATDRPRVQFAPGLLAFLVVTSWPIADLARSVSLLSNVLQRGVYVLAAAPLLLMGLPKVVVARLARPAPMDAVVCRPSKPIPALVSTTVLLVATALPVAIDLAHDNQQLRRLILLITLFAGVVLWLPVIDRIPGVVPRKPMAKGGYLFAQSLAPTFPSFAWIFALRPLYSSLRHQQAMMGLSALQDQPPWAGSPSLEPSRCSGPSRSSSPGAPDDAPEDDEPLHWVDVERAQRGDRRKPKTPLEGPPDLWNS
jgi:cytochrome c oxidase assembly factor CtaG